MHDEKRLYETTFIINASLEDPQIEIIITRIQEVIVKNGGDIVANNRWGRKRLMFPIKKKNSGYYINIEFNAPTSINKQLEHVYLLDENIVRFLTIKIDKKALVQRKLVVARMVEEPIAELDIPIIEDIKAPLFDDEEETKVS